MLRGIVHLLCLSLACPSPDPDLIFQASLSCGNLLLSLDHHPHGATVMGMLQSGRTLMALATVMFAHVPLKEVSIS